VIYDDDCGFCRWTLAVLLSLDRPRAIRSRGERGRPSPPGWRLRWGRSAAPGALRPLPLGTEEADRLLADLSVAERNASWHLVIDPNAPAEVETRILSRPAPPSRVHPSAADSRPEPARFSAGAALAPAVALLPGGRLPAAVLARVPDPTERAYRWVADHRGLLGRFVSGRARRWADRVIAAHGGPVRTQ
jgi:predicted DCC family thiol-disulfide oxidoreductase YuxK